MTDFRTANKNRFLHSFQSPGLSPDEFGARYSGMGRFMTADWAATPTNVPYAHFGNPQSLNLYSYVNNNPTTTADPDGHCPWCLALAGGGILADEAPLVFTGPVGWIILGGTAATLTGVAAYQHFHSSDNSNTAHAPQSNPAPGTQTGATPVSAPAVPLPPGLVGTQDKDAGPRGKGHKSGPLDPAHGGSGDAGKDFETLTGGKSGPAPAGAGYPAGTQVGDNGTAVRPATGSKGPRIDIPANGNKPAETLHYPKPTPRAPRQEPNVNP